MEAISCQHESAIIIGSDQVRELENDLEARESNAESLSPTVNEGAVEATTNDKEAPASASMWMMSLYAWSCKYCVQLQYSNTF